MIKSLLSTVYDNVFSSVYIHVLSELTLEPLQQIISRYVDSMSIFVGLHFNHISLIIILVQCYD